MVQCTDEPNVYELDMKSGLLVIRGRTVFVRLTVNLSLRQKLGLNEDKEIISKRKIISMYTRLYTTRSEFYFKKIKISIKVSLPSCVSRTQAASLLHATNAI